ncbi:hypothetical protein [Rhodococcus sp. 14-2483-1-2]|uniref:hypothetical protein n=1 Tax=Rhodococcus sp. 14-2483-1-2 TaxID=2023147 RepID=UPI000B9AB4EE|nr:hypothetical protein [Rhodococcus sp. 14-2483-1-2]OZF29505.1 hypothetical protein CH295_18395 [Rhodococcus sp. 14-2483-1-2]
MTDTTSGLADNLTYWRSLRDQANAGELHVEADVAVACDRAFSDYLEELDKMFEMTVGLSSPEGFGELPSAQMLGAKFHRLAIGEEGSASFAIKQQIEIIKTMREFFRHYFASVEATDTATAVTVEELSPPK